MSMSWKLLAAIPVATENVFRPRPNRFIHKIPYLFLQRNLSSKQLTPSVTFMSNKSTSILKRGPDLSQFSSDGRSLTVMFCWLAAKESAVNKFANFYLDKGFDVLVLRVSPWRVLFPKTIDPIVLNEIIPTLLTSNHQKKLIHGFSIGGYVFGRLLKYMHDHDDNDPTSRCRNQELMETMIAQIWDSVTAVDGLSVGVSKSLFINSKFLQKSLQNCFDFHQRIFYHIATKYYEETQWYFFNKPLRAPALFLGSKIDRISTVDTVQDCMKFWQGKGIACSAKFWSDTHHVGHMYRHPEQYKETVRNFIDSVLCQRETKMKTTVRLPNFQNVY